MLAGLVGGLVAFGVAKIVGEPQIDKAIAFEEYVAARAGDTDALEEFPGHAESDEELVTRSQQNFAGLGTGTLIYGAAMGGIFGLVFAVAYGRLGPLTARGTAAVLGLLGFVGVYLMPSLKYPPTPPAIGNPDSIDRRTWLYLTMIVLSVAAVVLAVAFRRWLSYRIGEWNATIAAALAYLAVMVVCFVALPGVNDIPQELLRGVVPANGDSGITFPPVVLWRFRVSALAVQVGLWGSVAIVFGYLAQRVLEPSPSAEPHRVDAA
jgi:predicted cobalt transporter CbtA